MVNQLNFKGPSLKVEGKCLAFTANGATNPPRNTQSVACTATLAVPIKLAADLTDDVAVRGGQVILPNLVAGTGRLIKNGEGSLRLDHVKNTFSGGTTINRGGLCMYVANEGLGSGPITLNVEGVLALEHVNGATPLILNGGEINANNGLMERAVICLDTSNAKAPVTVPADISDSKGPGGGAFLFKKCGAGTLLLTGKNNYSGQTILEGGSLSVSSLNSYVNGKPSSSLGASTDIETGEIVIGSGDGECGLIYTGSGESSDRVLNLAGKNSTVTLDQSGKGVWKLASTFVISGHSTNKIIALKGDTAGSGEIVGNIVNPHGGLHRVIARAPCCHLSMVSSR